MAGTTEARHGQQHERMNVARSSHVDEAEHQRALREEELEAARRDLDAFTYSVAHDLRAPLRLIHAHAQMLRDELEMARAPSDHLDQIQRGACELSKLIDGILTLSRLSRIELHPEAVLLSEIVERAIESVTARYGRRRIEWRVSPLPICTCDRELMQQAICILLDNAAKFSAPRAHACIEIGAEGGFLFIRDNGVGFDARYAGKIFDAFQRMHRQDEFEGAGLGLALARKIIERHGGRIWADARVGEGATFRFTLPA